MKIILDAMGGDNAPASNVQGALAAVREQGVDTLMLGCTHYPLLKPLIARYMGPQVTLVDVGEQCARWVAGQLSAQGLRAGRTRPGRHRYFVSDDTGDFAALASAFLGEDVGADVEEIDITIY